MKIVIKKKSFLNYLLKKPKLNYKILSLNKNIYVVKNFFSLHDCLFYRKFCINFEKKNRNSWFPLKEDVKDYFRIHNNFKKAHVKSIQKAFYFHPWNKNFKKLINWKLKIIFNLKLLLSKTNYTYKNMLSNTPKDLNVMRILVHNYPRGGGYQEPHIDPFNCFAKIQTIIIISVRNKDYNDGGFHFINKKFQKINVEKELSIGDLVLCSPDIVHSVEPIDVNKNLSFKKKDGRWIVMPIILQSDEKNSPRPKAFFN